MFFGSFKHSIDDKGRLVLPAKFRFAFPDKIYLLKGSDGAIELYNEKDFNDYLSHLSSFPFEKKKGRDIIRVALASVIEISVDSQGRILLPKEVLQKYGLKRDIMVVGVLSHIEIWDLEKWTEYFDKNEQDFEDNLETFYVDR